MPLGSPATARAMPKSASRARPVPSSSRTFSGFTSRCTTPARRPRPGRREIGEMRAVSAGESRPSRAQPLPKALSGDLVHHVIQQPVRATGRVNRHDIGMPQPGDGACLGQKPASDGFVGCELGMNHLDRDPAVQGGVGGEKDHSHAPATKLPLEPVLRPQRRLKRGEQGRGLDRVTSETGPRAGWQIYRSGCAVSRLLNTAEAGFVLFRVEYSLTSPGLSSCTTTRGQVRSSMAEGRQRWRRCCCRKSAPGGRRGKRLFRGLTGIRFPMQSAWSASARSTRCWCRYIAVAPNRWRCSGSSGQGIPEHPHGGAGLAARSRALRKHSFGWVHRASARWLTSPRRRAGAGSGQVVGQPATRAVARIQGPILEALARPLPMPGFLSRR